MHKFGLKPKTKKPIIKGLVKKIIEKTLTKILLSLIIVSVLLLFILCYIGVSLDKTFLVDTLKAIFANTLVFFIAIFCIDFINKLEQRRKFKLINKQISEFIFIKVTGLVFTLAEQIKIFDTKRTQEELVSLLEKASVSDEINTVLNNHALFKRAFYSACNGAQDQEAFLNQFSETARDFLNVVQKNLKEIYPHSSDQANTLLEKTQLSLGILCGSTEMFKMARKLKGTQEAKKENFTVDDFEKFEESLKTLSNFMYKTEVFGEHVESFFQGLSLLREKAYKNELFSEV